MARLKDRNKSIPYGVKFKIPALTWESKPGSFDSVVRQTIAARLGNPYLTKQRGWSTDYETVANEIDEWNANLCAHLGWWDYVAGGQGGATQPNPFPGNLPQAVPRQALAAGGGNRRQIITAVRQPIPRPEDMPKMSGSVAQAVASVKKLAAGGATLLEWSEEGMPHVVQSVADKRASICAVCPKNEQGKSLTEYFTAPLAAVIQKRFDKMAEMNLRTPSDDKLFTCQACLCPLRTKVWFPDELVLKRLKSEWKAELNQENPRCWILDLVNQQQKGS